MSYYQDSSQDSTFALHQSKKWMVLPSRAACFKSLRKQTFLKCAPQILQLSRISLSNCSFPSQLSIILSGPGLTEIKIKLFHKQVTAVYSLLFYIGYCKQIDNLPDRVFRKMKKAIFFVFFVVTAIICGTLASPRTEGCHRGRLF